MIPYGRQTIEDDDVAAVAEVLRSDWLTQGPKVEEFEKALASYCGAKHAVVFSSGTAALEGAYFAAGLKAGDEVVTSPITFAATATAAVWLGAKPVFADVDPATGNLSPSAAEAAITPKTRVLAPIDYSGRPVDLDAFKDIARRRDLVVIEDACHALGASYKGRKIGSHADMAVFSFHPVKSITTGEGGAVLTSDDGYAERLRVFRVHGVTRKHPDWRYEIGELSHNYRLTDMQCALGLSQLRKVDRFVKARARIAEAYAAELGSRTDLVLPPPAKPGESAWHLYPVRLRLGALDAGRAEIFAELRRAGVGVQVHYIPVYQHPLYQRLGYKAGLCPEAERFYESEISLPIFPGLSETDRKTVVRELGAILSRHAGKVRLPR